MTFEHRTGIDFPATDRPLRDDVRMLGAILGELLVELEGRELYESVEAIRRTARARRGGDPTAADRLSTWLQSRGPGETRTIARAFSSYFGLSNMAERVHRLRRRRDYENNEKPQPGGLRAVVQELAQRGFGREELVRAITDTRILPVFTAHPSEAIRRTLLRKEQRIAQALVDRFDLESLTPRENAAALARIRSEVASSWLTSEHGSRPTVQDEVEHVAFYLVTNIYRVLPAFYEELEDAVNEAWPDLPQWQAPSGLLRFGSWVGGDMDGNPNVGADTFEATLRRQRKLVLDRYVHELDQLASHLSQSTERLAIDERVMERVRQYGSLLPERPEELLDRYSDMPYRNLCTLMKARIRATQTGTQGAYKNAGAFLDDIRLMESTLEVRCQEAGAYRVRRLRRRAECFGFHLATLDVRQDALLHRRAVGELLEVDDFAGFSRDKRTELILKALQAGVSAPESPGADLARTLHMMKAIGRAQSSYDPQAVGPFIISMAQGPDDALAVLLLARAAGLETDGNVPLDVAPLFETADDLAGARQTMESLFETPVYRKHLDQRGDQQTVMIGYSDSGKDAGIMAARWALQQGQSELVAACEPANVALTIFHGRGGTISRGGTKTREAVLAAPAGSVGGRLRMTEQGEIIHARYGLRGIALRSLELATGAVLQRQVSAVPESTLQPGEKQAQLMSSMASASRKAYRKLVELPEFLNYFRSATPIDVIERMAIGSRPSSRRKQAGLEDLRAIPWVFAWNQSRHIVPGWYGVGSGLAAGIEKLSMSAVQALARDWPFFDTLLADIEMVLAKADLDIARRYADALVDSESRPIFERVHNEFQLTRELILSVRNADRLLEREGTLDRAIRLRNPYVDPMSFAQISLLQEWRAADRPEGELQDALFSTVKGIARGLQNTG